MQKGRHTGKDAMVRENVRSSSEEKVLSLRRWLTPSAG